MAPLISKIVVPLQQDKSGFGELKSEFNGLYYGKVYLKQT
jgi:hypothetical protein